MTYRLEGDDASLFTVASNGVVSLRVAQNYESPADTGSDNVYNYTLRVTDSDTNTAVIDVVVTVANIPPQIAYHSLSWGNVLSAVEQLTNGSINVLLTTAEDGDEVEFEVEGKVFSGQTINGSAEIEIPIDDIKLFSEGVLNYKLTVSDKWGSSSHESDKFTVDSSEPIRPEGIIERESYIIGESVLHELTANDETISVLEYGVIANADYDQTAKLEEAFRLANQAGKVLIFPDGTYLINSDIVVTKFDFRAENRYQVTFKNTSSEDVRIGGQRWEGKSTEGRIHGVIFDRVDLEFYGRTEPVKILDNIFRNSNIYVAHDAHQVIGNIFFNDDQLKHNAFAITSYKSKDLLVANNIIGSSSQKAEFHTNTYLSEDVVTQIKNEFNFDIYNQTSNYTTGIHNISDDLNASHLNNIIISEKTGGYFRDHANYSKAYVNLLYEGNYVSGWPPNGAGGMKFRNADGGLILRGNFLDDTNILTYAYDHHHTHLKLNDTFIYDNVIKAGPTFHIGDIGYWENSAVDITVDGYFIFNNHFVTDQPRINLAWQNSVGDDFKRIAYYDNTYEGDLIFTEFNNTNVPIETLKAKGNSLLDDEYPYLNEAYTNDNAVNRSRIYGLLEDDKEAGAQFIQLNESADTPILSVGNDTVFSGQGNDYLSGLDGNDRLISGLGDDHLYGGQGNDLLDGGAGSDILHGDSGYDLLFGRDGDDTLQGGYGNDILYGGLGDDYLSGGDGQDIFIFTNLMDGHDTISDFTLAARDNINNIIDGGDVMDFSSLLEGATYNTLSQYITISNDQGNIKLDVDYDGQAGANNTLVNITLLGISYLDHYATFLNEAINSGEINIV